MRRIHLEVKPVNDACNLRCTYCFYNATDQQLRTKMSEETLTLLLHQAKEYYGDGPFTLQWHGGEPLLRGLPFFRTAVEEARSLNLKCTHLIQTNATLLTDAWIDFFLEHTFRVGISIDGDAAANQLRIYDNGVDSTDRVVRNILHARERGLDPAFLAVVSRVNVDRPEAVFDFFHRTLNVRRFEFSAIDFGSSVEHGVTSEEFATFMTRVFDRWTEVDDADVRIRRLESMLIKLQGGGDHLCIFSHDCAAFLKVDAVGRIMHCSERGDQNFGNIHTTSLRAFAEGDVYAAFSAEVDAKTAANPYCTGCEWLSVCEGGCYRNYSEEKKKDYLCDSYKALFPRLREWVHAHGGATVV